MFFINTKSGVFHNTRMLHLWQEKICGWGPVGIISSHGCSKQRKQPPIAALHTHKCRNPNETPHRSATVPGPPRGTPTMVLSVATVVENSSL